MTDPEVPQNHIPSLDVVTSSYEEVREFNRKHAGFAAGMGNLLAAMIQEAEEDTDIELQTEDIPTDLHDQVAEATTEGDMQGELQRILHEDTFMRIGIRLAPFGSQLSSIAGDRFSSTELEPTLDNTSLFTEFLSQQDPETFQDDADHLPLVTDVLTTLQKTVATCYGEMPGGISAEEEQAMRAYGEDALRTFVQLDDEYKRLGLDNPTVYQHYIAEGTTGYLDDQWKRYRTATEYLAAYKTLEDYVTYWGRGVLPEYLATGSIESLRGDKLPYFDGMHDRLAAKVNDIVLLTRAERTNGFGIEAARAMLEGLRKTTQLIDDKPHEWFASEANSRMLAELTTRLQGVLPEAKESKV